MPHKDYAPGNDVLAADFNQYIADQVVAQYPTRAARTADWPSPPIGALSHIGTGDITQGIEVWNGVAWRPPWNLPWGLVAPPAIRTTNQAGNGAFPIDVAGLAVTFTAIANRRYRVFTQLVVQQSGAGAGVQNVAIRNAANNQLAVVGGSAAAAYFMTWNVTVIDNPGAGSTTYKVSVGTNAQTMDVSCTPSQIAFLTVEDVGPSGVPS
jgi:hypothetical protein